MSTDTITIPEEKGVETHGIERVSPASRAHVRIFDNFTMWLSANLVIPTVGLGALSLFFNLGFWYSLLAIILFNVLGILPVAFFSTLGPKLGLRQMTISRFSFGWVGAIIMAVFNIAACIGWSTVNVIIGGQLVAALSNGAIPAWAGILGIAVITTFVSLYGYRYVHAYERYAWLPMVIIFLILFFTAVPHTTIAPATVSGLAGLASFFTFGGAVFGFATGWSSYAADYNVNQPEETASVRVFWLTFLGCFIPCVFLEILGVLLVSVKSWGGAYANGNVGDLLHAASSPLGALGTFLLVLFALSIVANNVPNDYSLGLSIQVFGKSFQRVKRAVWTLLGAIIYVLIAIPLAQNFGGTLESFLLIIAYWLGPWTIILVLEHFVFRHGIYNVEDWNTRQKLPIGWAALISMALGLIGVYLGASQQLFTGPLAHALGGVDIGFELGVIIAGVSYFFLRPVELKNTGR
jgi:NCS1 nucleoside transporter family